MIYLFFMVVTRFHYAATPFLINITLNMPVYQRFHIFDVCQNIVYALFRQLPLYLPESLHFPNLFYNRYNIFLFLRYFVRLYKKINKQSALILLQFQQTVDTSLLTHLLKMKIHFLIIRQQSYTVYTQPSYDKKVTDENEITTEYLICGNNIQIPEIIEKNTTQ